MVVALNPAFREWLLTWTTELGEGSTLGAEKGLYRLGPQEAQFTKPTNTGHTQANLAVGSGKRKVDSQGQGREDEESSADSLCWAWKKSGSSSPGRVVNCSPQPSTRSLVNRAREAEKAGQSGSRRGRI